MKPANFLVYAVCGLSLCTAILFLLVRIPEALDGRSPADFPNYYFAGKRLLEGRPIYGDLETEVRDALGWEYSVYPADPPPALMLLAPLALLPYQQAWWLLAIASMVAMSLAVILAGRAVQLTWGYCIALAIISLGSTPFLFLLYRNHFEALIALLAVLGWRAIISRRQTAAGLFWGVAASLKLFPLLWIFLLIRTDYRKACLSGALTFALMQCITMAVVGWGNYSAFIVEVLPLSKQWLGTMGNYSLLSVLAALIGERAAYLGTALLGTVALLYWLRVRLEGFALFASAMLWSLIFSPLCWLNYLVLTHPVIVMAIKQCTFTSRGRIYLFAIAALPLYLMPEYIPGPTPTLSLVFSALPLAAMLGWLYSVRVRTFRA